MLRYLYEDRYEQGVMKDIKDGELYQQFLADLGPGQFHQNILVSFCTGLRHLLLYFFHNQFSVCSDGVNVTRRGQNGIWPMTSTILNFARWYVVLL